MAGKATAGRREAAARLAEIFRRNGYTRRPNMDRREEEKTDYKKGWEVRLVLRERDEADEVLRVLKAAGLKGARPFAKARQWVVPVYGKKAYDLFMGWAGDSA